MSRGRVEALENAQHLSGKDQIRRTTLTRRNFNVLPTNTPAPSRLQCFQRCFFCREARCIMLCCHGATQVAVFAFRAREDALGESRRAHEHFANSCNFDNVYTDGNDHD